MTTQWDGCDANPIEVVDKGFAVGPVFNGDGVEFCVEYDDSTWAGPHTSERYITISREDWNAIVAHMNRLEGQRP